MTEPRATWRCWPSWPPLLTTTSSPLHSTWTECSSGIWWVWIVDLTFLTHSFFLRKNWHAIKICEFFQRSVASFNWKHEHVNTDLPMQAEIFAGMFIFDLWCFFVDKGSTTASFWLFFSRKFCVSGSSTLLGLCSAESVSTHTISSLEVGQGTVVPDYGTLAGTLAVAQWQRARHLPCNLLAGVRYRGEVIDFFSILDDNIDFRYCNFRIPAWCCSQECRLLGSLQSVQVRYFSLFFNSYFPISQGRVLGVVWRCTSAAARRVLRPSTGEYCHLP